MIVHVHTRCSVVIHPNALAQIAIEKIAPLQKSHELRGRKWQRGRAWTGALSVVRYGIITYLSQHDEAFIADVPELPGCAADGGTYQEALDNVQGSFRSGSLRLARYFGMTEGF